MDIATQETTASTANRIIFIFKYKNYDI
jgi:hypothetical protein